VKNNLQGNWNDLGHHRRSLDEIEHDVQWLDFEILPRVNEEVNWLAEQPRFKWDLNFSLPIVCSYAMQHNLLCNMENGQEAKFDGHDR
jgi:hypothetical protein